MFFMSGELLAAIVFDLILYGTLACAAIPLLFFLLWTFFNFWKKYYLLFYFTGIVLLAAIPTAFYFTQHYWIYLYYPFPAWVQIIGLILIIFSYLVVKLAQASISVPVRFFFPVLKNHPIQLKTKGVYRYVRHPIYAVFPLIVIGGLLYTGELVLFPVFFLVLVTRKWYAVREEAYLKQNLHGDYEKYMKQTPNRFYPKIF